MYVKRSSSKAVYPTDTFFKRLKRYMDIILDLVFVLKKAQLILYMSASSDSNIKREISLNGSGENDLWRVMYRRKDMPNLMLRCHRSECRKGKRCLQERALISHHSDIHVADLNGKHSPKAVFHLGLE